MVKKAAPIAMVPRGGYLQGKEYMVLHPLEIYNNATREITAEFSDHPLTHLSGSLPDALKGVLFRNGPGRLSHHGYRYEHLFDGDGMVQRFLFSDGVVRYTNRYVRTREFIAEERAAKPLYRSFGTNLPGGLLRNVFRMHFKNSASTHVLLFNVRQERTELLVLNAATLEERWRGALPVPIHIGFHGVWSSDEQYMQRP